MSTSLVIVAVDVGGAGAGEPCPVVRAAPPLWPACTADQASTPSSSASLDSMDVDHGHVLEGLTRRAAGRPRRPQRRHDVGTSTTQVVFSQLSLPRRRPPGRIPASRSTRSPSSTAPPPTTPLLSPRRGRRRHPHQPVTRVCRRRHPARPSRPARSSHHRRDRPRTHPTRSSTRSPRRQAISSSPPPAPTPKPRLRPRVRGGPGRSDHYARVPDATSAAGRPMPGLHHGPASPSALAVGGRQIEDRRLRPHPAYAAPRRALVAHPVSTSREGDTATPPTCAGSPTSWPTCWPTPPPASPSPSPASAHPAA